MIPEYQGKHGHPILVGREMLEAFLKAPETSNAREVEHAHQSEIEYVPVDDPLVSRQRGYTGTVCRFESSATLLPST